MKRKGPRGLFVTGTDTEVGKTYVAALVASALVADGRRVGVYKPAASGCSMEQGTLVAEDAVRLWEAAGSPGQLEDVCPQRFAAPLAPHLAAKIAGRRIDRDLLRRGLEPWLESSEVVVIEGAGGLMSPMGDDEFVADLAYDLGFPLVVVAPDRLGVINHALQTLIAAATFRDGLEVAGIVLNNLGHRPDDPSVGQNAAEIRRHAVPPVLAEIGWQADRFHPTVDWFAVAATAASRPEQLEDANT